MSERVLRSKLIRLAYERPDLRPSLLPILKQARTYQEYVDEKKSKGEQPMPEEEWKARQDGGAPEKPEGGGASPPKKEEEGKAPAAPAEEPKSGWHAKFKGFLSKVKDVKQSVVEKLHKAPDHVKAFVADPNERKKVGGRAASALKNGAVAIGHRVMDAAKETKHEFKLAGKAVGKVFKGEKLDRHDKHALFAVGVTMAAVSVAAATHGTAAGAGTFGKAIARHIAANAVHSALGKLNVLGEGGHVVHEVGHGLLHMMKHGSGPVPGPRLAKVNEDQAMTAFANHIMHHVHGELSKGMSDEDIHKILQGKDPEGAEKYDDEGGEDGEEEES